MKRDENNKLPMLLLDFAKKRFLLGPSAAVAIIGVVAVLKGIAVPAWLTSLFTSLSK